MVAFPYFGGLMSFLSESAIIEFGAAQSVTRPYLECAKSTAFGSARLRLG